MRIQPTDIQQKYKYFAFISYSSKDQTWGRYLQKKLERYRLPARLASKRKEAPNRAYPIFRDETDLSGFKVRDALEAELKESRFLVVICSPRSAQSSWVNDEIQYFIDHGWEDRILPFIVEGVPYSGDPETECFPPALRNMSEDPLGVDVTALGKRKAFLRLVSALLDVKFDELVRRDSVRRFRTGLALGMLGLVAAGALGYGIWFNTEHSKYYNAVTFQNEVPVGLYSVSKEELATANDTYRITSRRGKVVRLENVNSLGVVKSPDFISTVSDYPILEYQYDDRGELITILQKDETGKVVFRKDLTANKETNEIAIDFHSPSNSLNAQALSADMTKAIIQDREENSKSEITRQRNTYDENGYLIRSLYQRDNLGTPACDKNGVYGKAYEYDAFGQVIRISNLNEKGQVHNSKYGWAYEVYTYDSKGNIIHNAQFDADGNPARDKQGNFATQYEYDTFGNPVSFQYLDQTGAPIDWLLAEKYEYNDQGMMVSRKFFHADGSPAYSEDGIHEYRSMRDDQGRPCGSTYHDVDGNNIYVPALHCASYRLTLDDAGRVLMMVTYDAQGQPACDPEIGAYGLRYAYDQNGYLCRLEYLDPQGNPTMSKNGFAIWCGQLDGDGRLLRSEYLDENGNFTRGIGNVAILENDYDTFGNCVGNRIYDENGDPCYHLDGYAAASFTYEDGNLISTKYFDTDGQPMLCTDNYHELRRDYDEKGNIIRWSYHDTAGNLIELKESYAVAEQDYDRYGNVITKRYYSALQQPTMVDGIYQTTWEYDARGREIREKVFSYIPDQMDYIVAEYAYDDRGNLTEERYYDKNGASVVSETYAARVVSTYDAMDNRVEARWFASNGQPMQAGSDTYENLRRQTFDAFGNKILVQHLNQDASGKEICLWQDRYVYDAFGNCIREEKLDGAGNLSLNEYGYAAVVSEYSPQGFLIKESFFDTQNQPCLYDNLVFSYEYTRNPVGMITEMRVYDVDGKPFAESSNIPAIIRYEFDARGFQTVKRCLNEKGEPFGTDVDPVSVKESYHDMIGYQTGSAFYDKTGQLIGRYELYTYINSVYSGSVAEAAGLQADEFLISLDDWCLFDRDTVSILYDMQAAMNRSLHKEKDLVVCTWAEDDTFHFRRVHLPEGGAGYRIASDTGDAEILGRMEDAYYAWLKENP